MKLSRRSSAEPVQTIEQIASALEAFLGEHPKAIVVEEGKVLFDMRAAKYALATGHGRCTLQLWSEERNIVRRVSAAIERGAARDRMLRLTTERMGQARPGSLDLLADRDRRTPTAREATRVSYLRALERGMLRGGSGDWGDWKADGFRTAMDLEQSFGPAYARGSLVYGQQAWAVIAVNAEETQATVDGILTLGVLWLAHCRENAGGRRLYRGLRLVVPRGMAALTASRLAWMNRDAAQWELWEFDQKTEEMERRDVAGYGDSALRLRHSPDELIHAPDESAARERFAESATRVMRLVPQAMRDRVEQRIRSGAEMGFLLHGLEFARARMGYAEESFDRVQEISFGTGANETPLGQDNAEGLRELVVRLCARRCESGERRDPLYRMQPERWLESVLRRDISVLDRHLDAAHVYGQGSVFASSSGATGEGMPGLLSVDRAGRLAVIEMKADEDLHLALDGLDAWARVCAHVHRQQRQEPDPDSGVGEFQRHGYFGGVRLSEEAPRLYLVAPALRVHPATEIVLRYLSPRVEWEMVGIDERWRRQVKPVWRKRRGDLR